MHTMVDTFLAILSILKINQYLVDKTSLSAHTSFLSMPTNLKFPVFVLAVHEHLTVYKSATGANSSVVHHPAIQ